MNACFVPLCECVSVGATTPACYFWLAFLHRAQNQILKCVCIEDVIKVQHQMWMLGGFTHTHTHTQAWLAKCWSSCPSVLLAHWLTSPDTSGLLSLLGGGLQGTKVESESLFSEVFYMGRSMAVRLHVLLKDEAEQRGQIYSTVNKEQKP